MSAKLLYSLTDDTKNLQKQIGCMNGFLQIFDRHHLVNSKSANIPNSRRLLPGEIRHRGRAANGADTRAKDKNPKVVQMQVNTLESSRNSVSSSSASTTVSSQERDWSIKTEESPLNESICTDKRSWDCRVRHKQHEKNTSSDLTPSYPSPIKTIAKEQLVRHKIQHMDSPRFMQKSELDSPKMVAWNDSFRSISSNQSAPILPHTKHDPDQALKDAPRFSFDGRETRETYISSMKLRDLPRLSLDSRQQIIKESVGKSRKDLIRGDLRRERQNVSKNQNLPEEAGSYRPPSNIVAKLMGLEALPDELPNSSPSIKTRFNQIDSNTCENCGLLSRSSKTIGDSQMSRGLYSPRNNCRDFITPQSNKGELVVRPRLSARNPTEPRTQQQPQEQATPGKSDSKYDAVSPEPQKQILTVYGEIEKRLSDLDFKRSGKDLRALKQILESMHGEKTMLLNTKANWSSDEISQTCTNSSTSISQKQSLRKTNCYNSDGIIPATQPKKVPTPPKDFSPRVVKQTKPVRETKQATTFVMQDLPPKGLHRIRLGHNSDGVKDPARKKSTKQLGLEADAFKDPSHQTHCAVHNFSGSRSPRIKTTSKATSLMTNVSVTSPAKNSKNVSHKQKPEVTGLHSQNGKLQQKSYILQNASDQSKEVSTFSAFHRQVNKISLTSDSGRTTVLTSTHSSGMKYNIPQLEDNSKNVEVLSDGTSATEDGIAVKEQPSPVSVLEAMFYDEESISPVMKKPTAFRAYEIDAAYTAAECKGIDLTHSYDSIRPASSRGKWLESYSPTSRAFYQIYTIPERKTYPDQPPQEEGNPVKEYVSEILSASGFLNDSMSALPLQAGQSQEAINSSLFFILEQAKGSTYVSQKRSKLATNERHQRKLLFDTVNELVTQKLSSTSLRCQPLLFYKNGKSELLQQIYEEIGLLHSESLNQSSYDEDDFLTAIIGKDFSHPSGNWTDFKGEIPGLALEIERLIFKDLIVELVHEVATKL